MHGGTGAGLSSRDGPTVPPAPPPRTFSIGQLQLWEWVWVFGWPLVMDQFSLFIFSSNATMLAC